jgi:hypothetical protein
MRELDGAPNYITSIDEEGYEVFVTFFGFPGCIFEPVFTPSQMPSAAGLARGLRERS